MVQVFVPAEEELKIENNGWICQVEGCGGLFQTSSQLKMHLTKHHEGRELSVRCGTSHYYCPVVSCERSLPNQKPFPRLGQLKQVCGYLEGGRQGGEGDREGREGGCVGGREGGCVGGREGGRVCGWVGEREREREREREKEEEEE